MSEECSPDDAALKSFFLGPQSENSDWLRQEVISVLDHWFQWRKDIFPQDGKAISRSNQKSFEFQQQQSKVHNVLHDLSKRFEDEVPQFSPRYVGHMFSEISLPALMGHFVALLHNPNNISTEGARVGAFIEDEAISDLAAMLGFNPTQATGHFTSGGTVANIEALWRARYRLDHFLALGAYLNLNFKLGLSYYEAAHMGWDQYKLYLQKYEIDELTAKKYSAVAQGPWAIYEIYRQAYGKAFQGPVVLVPNSKHYSWLKGISLLGLGDMSFKSISLDANGIMDINSLKYRISEAQSEDRPILMLVSVAGTTELGECDPVGKVQDILDQLKLSSRAHIWHHVDAAYGGYFCSLLGSTNEDALETSTAASFAAIRRTDSVTLDPHKLGYVPYACGAIIVPDELRYRVSAFEAKYIQSPNQSIDRWMKTLEGSRSAAGATATWMTAKTIGFDLAGYGKILGRTILARKKLQAEILDQCKHLRILEAQHLNLLCLVEVGSAQKLSVANKQTEKLIERINKSGEFVISMTQLKSPEYHELITAHCRLWSLEQDENSLTLLRMTLMNPFFLTKETDTSFPSALLQLFNEV